jgi:hypothetical protein
MRAASLRIVGAKISRETRLMTDEARMYSKLGKEFAEHGTTLHGGRQYVHPTHPTIHTNIVEGALLIFRRDVKGVYQHCGEQHLHRHLPSSATKHARLTASTTWPVRPKR